MSDTPPVMNLRGLLLVSKDDPVEDMPGKRTAAHFMLDTALNIHVEIVDSKAWFQETFHASGGWDSWAWETVYGRPYGSSRRSHFDLLITSLSVLGRANAEILKHAAQKKMASFLLSGSKVKKITSIVQTSDSWIDGFEVRAIDIV